MKPSLPRFRKVSKGRVRGWIREDIHKVLPSGFFADPASSVQALNGKVIKESRWRWAAIFALPDGGRVFFKKDRTKGFMESLKYLFLPSRGRKEWLLAYQLQKKNLNIPKPYGWLEEVHRGFVRESYYLSEAVGTGVSLIEDVARLKERSSIP